RIPARRSGRGRAAAWGLCAGLRPDHHAAGRRSLPARRDCLSQDDGRAGALRGRAHRCRSARARGAACRAAEAGPALTRASGGSLADGTTRRLSTEGADPLLLAGVTDANMLELERLLVLKVSSARDALALSGTVEQLERGIPVVQGMIDLVH